MSDEKPGYGMPAGPQGPRPQEERGPEGEAHLRGRLQGIAARLRDLAEELGGEVMIEIPSRLGDREGLLLALANELEELVK